jgi:hypothetical protein
VGLKSDYMQIEACATVLGLCRGRGPGENIEMALQNRGSLKQCLQVGSEFGEVERLKVGSLKLGASSILR